MSEEIPPISVLQGQYRLASHPNTVLTTILGSCVATCMWDPKAGVGGMNHFLLPGNSRSSSGNLRYGVNSMELLMNALLQNGAQRNNLHVKIFGGASMFENDNGIGRKNADFALWFAQTEQLKLVTHCLGGQTGRKVRFWPFSGNAQMKYLADTWADAPAQPMPETPRRRASDPGVVTLF